MSSRILETVSFTQVHVAHSLPVILNGAGAAAPTLGAGDPNKTYYTVTRASAGTYTVTLKNPYPVGKNIKFDCAYLAATPSATKQVSLGVPTRAATGLYSFPLLVTVSGTATDLPTGDMLSLDILMSNTTVVP